MDNNNAAPALPPVPDVEGLVEGLTKALALVDQWDAIQRTHKRRGLEDRFSALAASVYSDHDRVNVPIRFGDLRAAINIIAAVRALIQTEGRQDNG